MENTTENVSLDRKEIVKILKEKGFLTKREENVLPFVNLMTCYKCAMMELETKLNVLNEELSLKHDRNPISSIKSRLKTPLAIIDKLERKQIDFTLEAIQKNVNDVAGIRVCCPFVDDVYAISDALLRQDDLVLIEKKDYIQNPKSNGYRSLHLIVGVPIYLISQKKTMKVEVQLRTIAMDFWASIEHQLRYKKSYQRVGVAHDELKLCAQISALLDEKMGLLKNKILDEKD